MLNINEINNTISALESGDTTYDACMKLAGLYIVRERYNPGNSEELDHTESKETLPCYHNYCDEKKRYQMKQSSTDNLCECMKDVCKEIEEFIDTLYSSTECPDERKEIEKLVKSLYSHYSK